VGVSGEKAVKNGLSQLRAGEGPFSEFGPNSFVGIQEVFGKDISELHKRIMEERDEFRSRDFSQRAASLPITDLPPDGLLRELERPVFEVSLQQLARP
jgi:hypothetical protein